MEEEYKKRFTKHDIDCGYYVDEELACEEIKSNIDGSIGIQGDAISKLAILENMIEDGELVEVVRCKDCKHYDLMLGWCDIHSHYTDEILDTWDMFMDDDYCSDGERR